MATFNVGVNVLETDGRTAPAIAQAPRSITGFVVRSTRGVPNLPAHIRSFREFTSNFGSFRTDAYGAYAVSGFFANGGAEAYALRIVGTGAAPSSATLDTATAGTATLDVTAGMRGRDDPGEWGNELSVAVAANPRGASGVPAQALASVEPYTTLAAGDQLSILVNGSTSADVVTFAAADFTAGAASAAEVAAAINRQTARFRAAVAPGQRLLLAGLEASAGARLAISGTAQTKLGLPTNTDGALAAGATTVALQGLAGFDPGAAVRVDTPGHILGTAAITPPLAVGSGIDVTVDGGAAQTITFTNADFAAGTAGATSGEVVAAINARARGFSAALTATGLLLLRSNRLGTGSSIAVAAAAAGDARTPLGFTTAATPVAGVDEFHVVGAASEENGLVVLATPLVAAVPALVGRLRTVDFDFIVRRAGIEVERFSQLTMQNGLDHHVEAVVNDEVSGSRYVRVTDRNVNTPGADAPVTTTPAPLVNGDDGADPTDMLFLGDAAARTGLHAFDTLRIQLLTCPETTSPAVAAGCLDYCAARGDAMFVGTAPLGFDLEGIKTYASILRQRKAYGAVYAPWIEIANPLDTTGTNPRITVPPVGHVLGVYARIAEERGVWKAPAGDESLIAQALGTEFGMSDAELTDLVKNGGVNGIRAVPGAGIVVETSRTLSTDTRWLFVGTRRLFNFVKLSLLDGLTWVPQQPHDDALRRRVRFNAVEPFLLGLWQRGAFGTEPAEQVFTVRCDETNNPPAEVALGNFRIEVFFYPVKPAETIVIVVGQQEGGGSAAEA